MINIVDMENYLENDLEEVFEKGVHVLKFYKDGCAPCKELTNELNQLFFDDRANATIYNTNVSKCPEVAGQGGRSVPPSSWSYQKRRSIKTNSVIMQNTDKTNIEQETSLMSLDSLIMETKTQQTRRDRMTHDLLKAINWNNPDHKFYDDLYRKQTEQFWLAEEVPVSEDKTVWVKTYIEFNVNYALSCLGFEPMFDITENDVNPVVMNGMSIETKTHDFFSVKGNGYIKNTKVEPLQDEDFIF